MRQFNILILTLVFAVLTVSGCIDRKDKEVLVTPYTKLDFTSLAETQPFTISSNFLWTIEMADTWISVSPAKGYGDKQVTVTVQPNVSLEPRQTVFTIKGETVTRDIMVTQAGEIPTLSLDVIERTVPAGADTTSFHIMTNVPIEVLSGADWVQVVETRTVETRKCSLSFAANTKLEPRKATVEVRQTNGSLTAVFTLIQSGEIPTIGVDRNALTMPFEGGETGVNVTTNVPWTAQSNVDWITITPSTKLVTTQACPFVVAANPRVEPREGTVTIQATSQSDLEAAVVTVTQAGAPAAATLTPQVLDDIPEDGGTYAVAVEANFEWEIDKSQTAEWVSSLKAEEAKVRVVVDANPAVTPRSTTFAIRQKGGDYAQTVTINQLRGTTQIELTPQGEITAMKAEGDKQTLTVIANIDWDVVVSEDWLTATKSQVKDSYSGTIVLQAAENITAQQRRALLTVRTAEDSTLMRIITQEAAGPFMNPDSDTLDVAATQAVYQITIATNITPVVSTKPDWITASLSKSGAMEYVLSVTPATNTQTQERSGIITLKQEKGTLTHNLVIRQKGEAEYVNAALSTQAPLNNIGDTFSLVVESNMEVVVAFQKETPWITSSGTETEGRTTTYKYTAIPVPTRDSRRATLEIKHPTTGAVLKSFTVQQYGARIAQSDSLALVAFNDLTKGQDWRDTFLWNRQLPVSYWPGVTLEANPRNGALHVKGISLSNARLVGVMNDISGTHPLASLTYLETLDLSENMGLTGWLPTSWSQLAFLQTLNVRNCNLGNQILIGDPIPAIYGSRLTELTSFIISGNLMTGTVPAEVVAHPNFALWNFDVNMKKQKLSDLALP